MHVLDFGLRAGGLPREETSSVGSWVIRYAGTRRPNAKVDRGKDASIIHGKTMAHDSDLLVC